MTQPIIYVQPATTDQLQPPEHANDLKQNPTIPDPNMVQGQQNNYSGIPNGTYGQQVVYVGQPMNQGVQPNCYVNQGMAPSGQPLNYWANTNGYVDPTIVPIQNDCPQILGCPPGLEYLTQIDQLLVHQKIELFEVMSGYETNNRYVVKNILGQDIYHAKEDTDCFVRNMCGPSRPFVIHVSDNMNQEVIQIRRPYACNCCGQCFSCSSCCQDEVEVEAPPTNTVGYVKQLYEGCEVRYAILNEKREIVLRLHGPSYFHCYCPGEDYPLSLLSADGSSVVGKVSKQWTNLVKELFTDADNFGIQFPMDLDVKIKAVIIGSVFLLDFMYFENSRKRHQH